MEKGKTINYFSSETDVRVEVSPASRISAEMAFVAVASVAEIDPLDWQKKALCAQTDPELFHPEKGGSTRDAKKVCGACDVRSQCLESALENDERHGIWGGLSERERRRLRSRARRSSL